MAKDLERKLREIRDFGNASRDKDTKKALENAADTLKQALEQNSELAKNYSKVVSENENLRKENALYKRAKKEGVEEKINATVKVVNDFGAPVCYRKVEIIPHGADTKLKPFSGSTNNQGDYQASIPAGTYNVRAMENNFWGNPKQWKEHITTFDKENTTITLRV